MAAGLERVSPVKQATEAVPLVVARDRLLRVLLPNLPQLRIEVRERLTGFKLLRHILEGFSQLGKCAHRVPLLLHLKLCRRSGPQVTALQGIFGRVSLTLFLDFSEATHAS